MNRGRIEAPKLSLSLEQDSGLSAPPVLTVVAIIVNYRSATHVGELLGSIARHGTGWIGRVVIVDNASGDGSVKSIQARVLDLGIGEWVEVISSSENNGFGAGNNLGVAAALRLGAKPDVFWFLNPDTTVDNVELDPILAWFERDSTIGIVGTGMDDASGRRDLAGHRDPSPMGEFVRLGGAFRLLRRHATSGAELDRPGPVDWVSGASLMMRVSAFEMTGGFDENFFLYFEEVDLCRRARRAGWSIMYDPRVRIVHLEGQSTGVRSATARPPYWYRSRQRYFIKYFGRMGLLRADLAWALGRVVGMLRRRVGDGCRWRELWRCDAPVILGRECPGRRSQQ